MRSTKSSSSTDRILGSHQSLEEHSRSTEGNQKPNLVTKPVQQQQQQPAESKTIVRPATPDPGR